MQLIKLGIQTWISYFMANSKKLRSLSLSSTSTSMLEYLFMRRPMSIYLITIGRGIVFKKEMDGRIGRPKNNIKSTPDVSSD